MEKYFVYQAGNTSDPINYLSKDNPHNFHVAKPISEAPDKKLSNDLEQALEDIYSSFDSEWSTESLGKLYDTHGDSVLLSFPKIVQNIARKHKLPLRVCKKIIKLLSDRETRHQTKIYLAQSLKYLEKKQISAFEYLPLLKQNHENLKVREELTRSLAETLKQQNTQLSLEIIQNIEDLIKDVSPTIKSLLRDQIQHYREFDKNNSRTTKSFAEKSKISKNNQKKRPGAYVSRAQQKSTVSSKNCTSEETALDAFDFSEALKSKMKNMRRCQEKFEPLKEDGSQSNFYWHNGTFKEVVNFHNKAPYTALTNEEKEYLGEKLINYGGKYFCRNKFEIFAVDKMIIATFFTISKRQALSDQIINKLINCLAKKEDLKAIIFDSESDENIARDFVHYLPKNHKNDPLLVKRLAEKIFNETITVESGWVYNTLKHDEKKILAIISEEIDQMRRDAISTIHETALHNQKILDKTKVLSIQACLEDEDPVIRRTAIRILSTLVEDKNVDYKDLFQKSITEIEKNTIDLSDVLDYVYQQTLDPKRCLELFDEPAIVTLSKTLNDTNYKDEVKLSSCEIILNYLTHHFVPDLKEDVLKIYEEALNYGEDSQVKVQVVKIIWMVARKAKKLPNCLLQTLISSLGKYDVKVDNLILIILFNLEAKVSKLDEIAKKLLDTVVILGDGADIDFQPLDKKNSSAQTISSVAARIIFSSINSNIAVPEDVIDLLVKALAHEDKQTRIISAKCLFWITKSQRSTNNETLISLRDYITDSITDVYVYTTAALSYGVYNLSQDHSNPILASHIEFLPNIYVFENLMLNDIEFKESVNTNILNTLLNETKKGMQLPENIFEIFDYVLTQKQLEAEVVLDLLFCYVRNRHLVPQNTLTAIESCLKSNFLSSKALDILEMVIQNEQMVDHEVLEMFANNLLFCPEESQRLKSFKLLNKANKIQELKQDIFDKLEMERAGFMISESLKIENKRTLQPEIDYLRNKIKGGQRMSLNNLDALVGIFRFKERSNPKLKDILLLVAEMVKIKQALPDELMEHLTDFFEAKDLQMKLFDLFLEVTKNNQTLPDRLLNLLSGAVMDPQLQEFVIPIFLFKGQRGDKLHKDVIESIFQIYLKTNRNNQEEEYLTSVSSIIRNNQGYDGLLANEVLKKGIMNPNPKLRELAIRGYESLTSLKISLTKDSLCALVDLAVHAKMDLQKTVISILEKENLEQSLKNKLSLVTLNSFESEEKLNVMIKMISQGERLLSSNFSQINTIICQEPNLLGKVLEVLLMTLNKEDIDDDLLKNLCKIIKFIKNESLVEMCLNLIQKISLLPRRRISGNVLDFLQEILVLEDQKTHKLAKEILLGIAKNQTLPADISLFLKLSDTFINKADPKLFSGMIADMNKKLKLGNKLPKNMIKQLEMILHTDNKSLMSKDLAEIFASLVKDNQINMSKEISALIEQAIKAQNVTFDLINTYKKLLSANYSQDFEGTIKSLCEMSDKKSDLSSKEKLALFECLVDASKYYKIPQEGITFLENNLSSLDNNVRRSSFIGLKELQSSTPSSNFSKWCQTALDEFQKKLKIDIKSKEDNGIDLDLLETIISVKYISVENLAFKPQNEWNKELLISDLLARFNLRQLEKYQPYTKWLEIDSMPEYQNERGARILKLIICAFDLFPCKFDEINDILTLLEHTSFDQSFKLLGNIGSSWFVNFKQDVISSIMIRKCSNSIKMLPDLVLVTVSKALKTIDMNLVLLIISKIDIIENLSEFEKVISFFQLYKIKSSDIQALPVSTLTQLQETLEISILCSHFATLPLSDMQEIFTNLINNKWTFEKLESLIAYINANNYFEAKARKEYLSSVFKMIYEYELPSLYYEKVVQVLQSEIELWIPNVHQIVIQANFDNFSKVRDLDGLIDELNDQNYNNNEISSIIKRGLKVQIKQILDENLKSKIMPLKNEPISTWKKNQIKKWAKKVKKTTIDLQDSETLIECLSVIKKAYFLFTGFNLTNPQIISIMLSIYSQKSKGRLLQVATGEGKSTIISILAILYSLLGKKIDIITSSAVLATRDSIEKAGLYRMFKLSCGDNEDKQIIPKGKKDCYRNDIVYGEATQFQFDILRDEYSKQGTLCDRKKEFAIIDEVDSMLIDDSSRIARLSNPIPGIDLLQPIYYFLWYKLFSLKEHLIEISGKTYYMYGKINYETMALEFCDDNGDIYQIPNLEGYIKSGGSLENIGHEILEDEEVFIRDHLQKYLMALTTDKKVEGFNIKVEEKLSIPANFKQFVADQIPTWVENAITAYCYQENVEYIVYDGLIKPVDFENTGQVLNFTNWSGGLHQFLQIKHNLKVTSESLTTNFLSNIGFFNRYGSNIIGFTGTLGSDKAKSVLENVYNVDFAIVPQLYQKQYKSLPAKITNSHQQWKDAIVDSAITEARKNRGVLIICQTINDVEQVAEQLKIRFRAAAIKLYTQNNMNQEKDIEKISEGEIVVATNLAGRGTDIKTESLEKNGGLHVIVTFLPANLRIEEQAFGRTARHGKKGTGQMILNTNELAEFYDPFNIKNIKQVRDDIETKKLDEFVNSELVVIRIKDELFKKFCELLDEIRKEIKKRSKGAVYEENILAAIEERWAMFLCQVDQGTITLQNSEEHYKLFASQVQKDNYQNCVIKSPYYHIAIGYDLLHNAGLFHRNYKESLTHFEKAIEIEERHSAAALFGQAWCLLKGEKGLFSTSRAEDYKNRAREKLNKAIELTSQEIGTLQALQFLVQKHTGAFAHENDLSKQLIQKINLLGSYFKSLQSSSDVINRSLRPIDVTIKYKFQNSDRSDNSREEREDYSESMSELICYKYGLIRNNTTKKIMEIEEDKKNALYCLSFNYLTASGDSENKDQAIDTIKTKVSSKVEIQMNDVNKELFLKMLNRDEVITQASKETVIAKLDELKSFTHKYLKLDWFSTTRIKLEITLDDEIQEKLEESIGDMLKLIENKNDDNLRYNLTITDTNKKTWELLKEKVFEEKVAHLEVMDLNAENAKDKILIAQPDCIFNLEIIDYPLNLFDEVEFEKVRFLDYRNNNSEVPCSKQAKIRIKQEDKKPDSIKIEKLSKDQACNVVTKFCPNSKFNIEFIGLGYEPTIKLLNCSTTKLNISFKDLKDKQAIDLIPEIRKNNIEFNLIFNDLKQSEAKKLVRLASIDQEDIKIARSMILGDLFLNSNKPTLELNELAARGIEYHIQINEMGFVPWRSIVTVCALSGLQMALGGALVTFAPQWGLALIAEGTSDLLTVKHAYTSRSFSWTNYCQQKAISLVISATTMGLQAIKDAGKAIKNMAVTSFMKNEAIEQAGQKLVCNKVVEDTIMFSGKNLKNLALKQMQVAIGETILREGLTTRLNNLCDFALEKMKPRISSSIQTKVKEIFYQPGLLQLVQKMHAIDVISQEETLKMKIDKIIAKIFTPTYLENKWDSMFGPLCKGILSDSKFLGNELNMFARIGSTLLGSYQLATIINKVYEQLVKELSKVNQESLAISCLLHKYCAISKKESREITVILRDQKIIEENEFLNPKAFNAKNEDNIRNDLKSSEITLLGDIDLKDYEKYKNKIQDFLSTLYKNSSKITFDDLSTTIKSVTDAIVSQIIMITESHLISPWSSYGMGMLTNAISKRVQHNFVVDEKENTSAQLEEQEEDKKIYQMLEEKVKAGHILTEFEKKFYDNYDPYNTIAKQIMANSKDYSIAYSQREVIYHSLDQGNSKSTTLPKSVAVHAEKIKQGKPAELSDMFTIAKMLQIDIKIVDDLYYEPNEIEAKNNTKIIYFQKGGKDSEGYEKVGHYYIKDLHGNIINLENTGNDCGYSVMAYLSKEKTNIEFKAEDLRLLLANHIECNPKSTQRALESQEWIESHYPKEANALLFRGGSQALALRNNDSEHNNNNNNNILIETEQRKECELDKKDDDKFSNCSDKIDLSKHPEWLKEVIDEFLKNEQIKVDPETGKINLQDISISFDDLEPILKKKKDKELIKIIKEHIVNSNKKGFKENFYNLIRLYTLESSVYEGLNQSLRDENKDQMKKYIGLFLKLQHCILNAPKNMLNIQTVYRGDVQNIAELQKMIGQKMPFNQIKSFSLKESVAKDHMHKKSPQTAYEKKCFNILNGGGVDISSISYYPEEFEVIIPNGQMVKLEGISREIEKGEEICYITWSIVQDDS